MGKDKTLPIRGVEVLGIYGHGFQEGIDRLESEFIGPSNEEQAGAINGRDVVCVSFRLHDPDLSDPLDAIVESIERNVSGNGYRLNRCFPAEFDGRQSPDTYVAILEDVKEPTDPYKLLEGHPARITPELSYSPHYA